MDYNRQLFVVRLDQVNEYNNRYSVTLLPQGVLRLWRSLYQHLESAHVYTPSQGVG